MRIATGHRFQHGGDVRSAAREYSDLIKGRAEGDQPVTRDSAVGGLEADYATQRRGLPN